MSKPHIINTNYNEERSDRLVKVRHSACPWSELESRYYYPSLEAAIAEEVGK